MIFYSLTNKDKSTEIFPSLLCKPLDIYAHVQCIESQKGPQTVLILKKTTGLFPSKSDSSMVETVW